MRDMFVFRHFLVLACVGVLCSGSLACKKKSDLSKVNDSTQTSTSLTSTGTGTVSTSTSSGGANDLSSLLNGLLGGGGGLGSLGGAGQQQATGSQFGWDPDMKKDFTMGFLNPIGANYLVDTDKAQSKASSMFRCPGDGLLVGLDGYYSVKKKDRTYQPRCQYFSDDRGYPVKKKNCTVSTSTFPKENFNFACPSLSQVLTGIQTTLDSGSGDRVFNFECCEMENYDSSSDLAFVEKVLQAGSAPQKLCVQRIPYRKMSGQDLRAKVGVNDQVNRPNQILYFACPNGTTMYQLKTTYLNGSTAGDRQFSFDCCVLGPKAAVSSTDTRATE